MGIERNLHRKVKEQFFSRHRLWWKKWCCWHSWVAVSKSKVGVAHLCNVTPIHFVLIYDQHYLVLLHSIVCHLNCKTGHKFAANATSFNTDCTFCSYICSCTIPSILWMYRQRKINRLLTGQLSLFPGLSLDKRGSVLIDWHSLHNVLCVILRANRLLTRPVSM